MILSIWLSHSLPAPISRSRRMPPVGIPHRVTRDDPATVAALYERSPVKEIPADIEAVKKLGGGPSPSGRGRRNSLIEAGAPGEGRAEREPARSASPREARARAKRKRDSAQPQAIGRSLKRSLVKS